MLEFETMSLRRRTIRFLVICGLIAVTTFPARRAHATHSSPAQVDLRSRADSRQGIVIGANLVDVAVSVSDRQGRLVPGLTKDEFAVFDDGVKQEVAHFSDLDAPISVGIVYDVSGSVAGSIGRSAQALERFIETSHQENAFFLVTFNGRAVVSQDFTRGDPASIVKPLASMRPNGQTALYDAMYLALERVKQGPHARRAILVISDGRDNYSSRTFAELRDAIRESGVIIYAVGIAANSNDKRPDAGPLVLDQIAETSGGRAFFAAPYDQAGLMQDCARIALELRHQYSLGFYPSDPLGKAKHHRIRIKVDAPRELGRLSLSYRGSYQSFRSPNGDLGRQATH